MKLPGNAGKAVLILLILLVLTGIIPLLSGDILLVHNSKSISKADVIIVLGYPALDNGQPSETMRSRVDRAVSLYNQGLAPYMLFTGGAVKNEFAEADVMADYAVQLGLPETQVLKETAARETLDNARYCVDILREKGWHTAIVVTSPYHTARARMIFQRYPAIQVSTVESQSPAEMSLLERIQAIWYEFVVYAAYFFSGKLK